MDTEKLIAKIEAATTDEKVTDFIQKLRTWRAFFAQIWGDPKSKERPKNHAIIYGLNLALLCGMAESYEAPPGTDTERVTRFLNKLSTEEKLLFTLSFEIKSNGGPHIDAANKYTQTQDDNDLNTAMALMDAETEKHEAQNEEILRAYIADEVEKIDAVFEERASFLYGIRSKIFHEGSPDTIVTMLMDGWVVGHLGTKGNKFFSIDIPLNELEQFFLRALARGISVEPEPVDAELQHFLWHEMVARHAQSVGMVDLKLRQKRSTSRPSGAII